jgi:glycogen debranching enzyme
MTSNAYQSALELLYSCSTPEGFLASPQHNTNYRRIWARDGVIIGLAALISEDQQLIAGFRSTLLTLAQYQGPHGEIPSNVEPVSQRISYGGTTGRIDANLWFIIGCCEYWLATEDQEFLKQVLPAIEKVRFLLGAWEFNNRGLIYVPQAGDWADEYLQSGYVLYDELLYYQALRDISHLHEHIHGTSDHNLIDKFTRLKHLIQANYWLSPDAEINGDVYHNVLFEKGLKAQHHCAELYWMPFFSPTGYGYRFDAFANILASLFNISSDEQRSKVDQYIESIVPNELPLIPAFHPVIKPVDEDWKHLQMTFSFTFKNKPYEFHNGGLWPMLSGFYVADLSSRGEHEKAQRYANAIDDANLKPCNKENNSFAEYFHGEKLTPGGTCQQGWSAAASIIAHHSLLGRPLFHVHE